MNENIFLSAARYLLPKNPNGKLVHIKTIHRWITTGIKRNGRRIKLKAVPCGGRLTTRPEWIEAFNAELNGRTEPDTKDTRKIGPMAAKRILIEAGVYGRQAQREMLDRQLRSRRGHVRTVPTVLPEGAARHPRGHRDSRVTSRSQEVSTAAHKAAH